MQQQIKNLVFYALIKYHNLIPHANIYALFRVLIKHGCFAVWYMKGWIRDTKQYIRGRELNTINAFAFFALSVFENDFF